MANSSRITAILDQADKIAQRIEHYTFMTDDGCKIWLGGTNNQTGYGKMKVLGKMESVHRMAFLLKHEWLPERGSGIDIDHLCRNRACCNPEHLEAVTHQENLKRGGRARELERIRRAKRVIQIYIPEGLWEAA